MKTNTMVSIGDALSAALEAAAKEKVGFKCETVSRDATFRAARVERLPLPINSKPIRIAREAGLIKPLPTGKPIKAKARRRAAELNGARIATAQVRELNSATLAERREGYTLDPVARIEGIKAKAHKAKGGFKGMDSSGQNTSNAIKREEDLIPTAAELVRGNAPALVSVLKSGNGARLDRLELSGKVSHALTSNTPIEPNADREAREAAELTLGADQTLRAAANLARSVDRGLSAEAADLAREADRVLLAPKTKGKRNGRLDRILRAVQLKFEGSGSVERATADRARLVKLAAEGNKSASILLRGEVDPDIAKAFLRRMDKENAAREEAADKARDTKEAREFSAARVAAELDAKGGKFGKATDYSARLREWTKTDGIGLAAWQAGFARLAIGATSKAIRRVTLGTRRAKLDGSKPTVGATVCRRVGKLHGEGWNTAGRISAARLQTTEGSGSGSDWQGAATAGGGLLVVSDSSREEAFAAASGAIADHAAEVARRAACQTRAIRIVLDDDQAVCLPPLPVFAVQQFRPCATAQGIESVLYRKFSERTGSIRKGKFDPTLTRGRAWFRAADRAASRAVSTLGCGMTGNRNHAQTDGLPISVVGIADPSEWGKLKSAFQPPSFDTWRESNADPIRRALRLVWQRIVAPSFRAHSRAKDGARHNARQSYRKNRQAFRIVARLLAGESLPMAAEAEGAQAVARLERGATGKAAEAWRAIVAAACAPRDGRKDRESLAGVSASFLIG